MIDERKSVRYNITYENHAFDSHKRRMLLRRKSDYRKPFLLSII